MRKYTINLILIIVLGFLVGCGQGNVNKISNVNAKDYLPSQNTEVIFETKYKQPEDKLFLTEVINYTAASSEEVVQYTTRTMHLDKPIVVLSKDKVIYQNNSNSLVTISLKDNTGLGGDSSKIIFCGNAGESIQLNEQETLKMDNKLHTVNTPVEVFKDCVLIERTYFFSEENRKKPFVDKNFYAKGIGLVKSITVLEGKEDSVKELVSLKQVTANNNKAKELDILENAVNTIKNASFTRHPGIKIGQAYKRFFAKTAWKAFVSTEDRKIVEFSGICYLYGRPVKVIQQFQLQGNGFNVVAASIDGKTLNAYDIADLTNTVMKAYANR